MLRLRVWCCALALLFSCCGLRAAEVSGRVTLSPARPGPQRVGEPSARPFSAATVVLRRADGKSIARVTADARGEFVFDVAPGRYRAEIDTKGAMLPRCDGADLQITDEKRVAIEIRCDSGMR